MKYWKACGVAVSIIALSTLAFAGIAWANTVTDSSGNGTPTIHSVSIEDGAVAPGTKHVILHNDIWNIECESTVEGTVSVHGAGVTTSGPINVLSFFNCTGAWQVDVISNGTLELHTLSTEGHGKGMLTSSGATVVTT